jgi:hypothetical protein
MRVILDEMVIENSSFRDGAQAPDPESRDSGFDASHRPGMTASAANASDGSPELCLIFPMASQLGQ